MLQQSLKTAQHMRHCSPYSAMKKLDLITEAQRHGIDCKEMTFGIWDPIPCYSIAKNHSYHVTLSRTVSELKRGIRIIGERTLTKLPACFN
jgi:hypothetical protein